MRNTSNITKKLHTISKRLFTFILVFVITLISCVSHRPTEVYAAGLGVGTLEAFYYYLQSLELGVAGHEGLTHYDLTALSHDTDSWLYKLYKSFKESFFGSLAFLVMDTEALALKLMWNKAFEGDRTIVDAETGESSGELVDEDEVVLAESIEILNTGAAAGSGEASGSTVGSKGLTIDKNLNKAIAQYVGAGYVEKNRDYYDYLYDVRNLIASVGLSDSYQLLDSYLKKYPFFTLAVNSSGAIAAFSNSSLYQMYDDLNNKYYYGSCSEHFITCSTQGGKTFLAYSSSGKYSIRGREFNSFLSSSSDLKSVYSIYTIHGALSSSLSLDDSVSYKGKEATASDYVDSVSAKVIDVGQESVEGEKDENVAVIPFPSDVVLPDIGEGTGTGTGEGTDTGEGSQVGNLVWEDAMEDVLGLDLNLNGKFDFLKTKFPFCIPYDFLSMLKGLNKDLAQAPFFHFEYYMSWIDYTFTFDVDLSDYEKQVEIFREGFFLVFLAGLMIVTGRLIKWT